MIIGNGDIAGAIIDRPDRLYFCSGVSNSGETRASEYGREVDLLNAQPRGAHLVYFGTLSELDTPYTRHKRDMEWLVKKYWRLHAIIRIGNIAWKGNNRHTLLNHFREQVRLGLPLDVQDVYRYVIEKDEFQEWLDRIPDDHSIEFNCLGRRMKVAQIAEMIKRECHETDTAYAG